MKKALLFAASLIILASGKANAFADQYFQLETPVEGANYLVISQSKIRAPESEFRDMTFVNIGPTGIVEAGRKFEGCVTCGSQYPHNRTDFYMYEGPFSYGQNSKYTFDFQKNLLRKLSDKSEIRTKQVFPKTQVIF